MFASKTVNKINITIFIIFTNNNIFKNVVPAYFFPPASLL